MIAKGNLHANGGKLAAYLTTGKDGERAELVELRGFAADNIRDAFTDVQIQAEATRATKPFFHAYIRLPEGEALARGGWQRVADRIEKGLGFEGQGRAVAFHYKANGETHMHIAWSRIDLETMRAIDPGLYKNKLKEMSRELERDLGLTMVRNERAPEQKTRAAGRNEFEQARRLDTNLTAIRETIRECWDRSDSGRAFGAALDEKGLILARGDRRDFVVIDREGGMHALSKRITGVTAPEIRARMADLDRAELPSVAEARAQMRTRQQDHPAARPSRAREEATPAPGPSGPSAPPHAVKSPAPEIAARSGMAGTARGAGKVLDEVAKAAGSFFDLIGNAFAPSPAKASAEDKDAQPVPPTSSEPSGPTSQADAARLEEQQRAERVQALVSKYGVAPSPEMERDAELRPGRERDRER
jgi:hypothetical protein